MSTKPQPSCEGAGGINALTSSPPGTSVRLQPPNPEPEGRRSWMMQSLESASQGTECGGQEGNGSGGQVEIYQHIW